LRQRARWIGVGASSFQSRRIVRGYFITARSRRGNRARAPALRVDEISVLKASVPVARARSCDMLRGKSRPVK
jgi:hypothetical protein